MVLAAPLALALAWVIASPRSTSPTSDVPPSDSSVVTSTERINRPAESIFAASVESPSQPEGSGLVLTDGDATTLWFHPTDSETVPELTFEFGRPVTFTGVALQNPQEGEAFARHARIRDVEVSFKGSREVITAEIPDTPGRHRIEIPDIASERATIRIVSMYPGQEFEGGVPFAELALAEVAFEGFSESSP